MGMEHRPIVPADVPAVVAFALAAIQAVKAPVHVSASKVQHMVEWFASNAGHFQHATFMGGVPVAAVAMCVVEMPFHERCEGHVMFALSRKAGAGSPLVRRMMEFVGADMRIQRVQWAMNEMCDEKLVRVIQRRWGFRHQTQNLIFYKEGG